MNEMRILLEQVLRILENLGPLGPPAFVLLFFVWTTLFLPGVLMLLAAGALFGVPMGFCLVSLSSVLSASIIFLAGRYLSRGWVLKKIASNEKIRALDDAVAEKGWKMVFLLRCSALLPFPLMNYALGLSKIRFKHYILASWIGMMPGTFLYVYLGSVAGRMFLTAEPRSKMPVEWVFIAIGFAMTAGVAFYSTRIVKKALKTR